MAFRFFLVSVALLCACSSDDGGDGADDDGDASSTSSGTGASGAGASGSGSGPASGAGASGGGASSGAGAQGGGGSGAGGGASSGAGGAVEPANACESCFFDACPAAWSDCQADPSGYCTLFLPAYHQCVAQPGTQCCENYVTAGPAAQALVDCWTESCASDCPCP